jgi:hypothetical protein
VSATYDPTLLSALDRLRFLLGDTDTAAALLPDETYTAMLASKGADETLAAIALADALIARFAQLATRKSVDGAGGAGSVEYGNRLAAWRELAARLRKEVTQAAIVSRGSGGITRPSRADDERGGEYYAGGREPLDCRY